MKKNTWKRCNKTGYFYTETNGQPDERYFIIPGIFDDRATLYAYDNPKPLMNGTLEECQQSCERAGYQEECDHYAIYGNPQQDDMDYELNAMFDDQRERYGKFVDEAGCCD